MSKRNQRPWASIYGKVYDNVPKVVIGTGASVAAPPDTVTNNAGSYTFTTPGAITVDVTASATGQTSTPRSGPAPMLTASSPPPPAACPPSA